MRWTLGRKEKIIGAVARGEVTFDAAVAEHGFSVDELLVWVDRYKCHGRIGLKQAYIQKLRSHPILD